MNRRDFLRASAKVGVGAGAALVVGDQALELFERLTWKRRLFPGWEKPHGKRIFVHGTDANGERVKVEISHSASLRDFGNGKYKLSIELGSVPPMRSIYVEVSDSDSTLVRKNAFQHCPRVIPRVIIL